MDKFCAKLESLCKVYSHLNSWGFNRVSPSIEAIDDLVRKAAAKEIGDPSEVFVGDLLDEPCFEGMEVPVIEAMLRKVHISCRFHA